MSASRFVRQAARPETQHKDHHGLSRGDRCSCHPQAWGLKKGLRRGRRRLDKIIIREACRERERNRDRE